MSNLPSKFCGFPIYLQMNPNLSFACFCPSEHGSTACKLHPEKVFRTLDIRAIISHVEEHISAGDEHDGDLQGVIEELTEFIPKWKRLAKKRGGVG